MDSARRKLLLMKEAFRIVGCAINLLNELNLFCGRDVALRCPRRVQRRNSFDCQCRSGIGSARYYAGGDGAARHPYHPVKQQRTGP